jgi:hypothetical protein
VVAEGVVAGEGFAADAGADSGPLAARAVCVVASQVTGRNKRAGAKLKRQRGNTFLTALNAVLNMVR